MKWAAPSPWVWGDAVGAKQIGGFWVKIAFLGDLGTKNLETRFIPRGFSLLEWFYDTKIMN